MAVYRFRMLHEDLEDFYRDIDILSSQTFEDLHNAIQQSINFDNKQLASFNISDDQWRKGKEITLVDMGVEDKPTLMKDSVLVDSIDDPHQRFIYTYDYMVMWEFYLELFKIIPTPEAKKVYPCTFKASGDAPIQNTSGGVLGAAGDIEEDEFGNIAASSKLGSDDLEDGFGEDNKEDEDEFGFNEFNEED